jgi:SAM-dependent methyltransferase
MRNTGADWEKLATDNPYWAVLTEDQFKGPVTEASLENFFQSGERDVEGFIRMVNGIFPSFSPPFKTVVDLGCGVGRLLLPMARKSAKAYGIDVSPTMRQIASQHAATAGLSNVECVATAEELVSRHVKADWVSSFIVLQHIEPRIGYFILNDLLQCVKPGGFASLHIPLFKTNDRREYYNDRVMYFRNDYYHNETVFVDRDTYTHPDMQMFDYNANTVLALFHKNEMRRVTLIHDGATSGIHAFHFVGQRGT